LRVWLEESGGLNDSGIGMYACCWMFGNMPDYGDCDFCYFVYFCVSTLELMGIIGGINVPEFF